MINIAILGLGNIGSGVADLISRSEVLISKEVRDKINIKYVLDLRDFKGTPYENKVVHDIGIIADDPEISIVCETMGGASPAFEYSMRCLQAGKHVVTSNKEVVANFGNLLCDAARDNGVRYMYEASVGGGIPIIRTIKTAFAGTEITEINGILNGTTNYILTRMKNNGKTFEEALKEAQDLGYAERNPSADINGDDSCRKICILAALAFGSLVNTSAISCEGISGITLQDISLASEFGGSVKLIASAVQTAEGKVDIRVSPCLVKKGDPINGVEGVYNVIKVTAKLVGDVMLYGQGAGKYPTAGAVLSDIIAIASGSESLKFGQETMKCADETLVCDEYKTPASYYAVVSDPIENVKEAFGDIEELLCDEDKTAFICHNISRQRFENTLKEYGLNVLSKFRAI